MPPRVASLREVHLPGERYSELAKEWAKYAEGHPAAAIAYVYLWRARKYAQEAAHPDGLELVQKAYGIDPRCPEVLSELASLRCVLVNAEPDRANADLVRSYAEQAIDLRPDWYEPHVPLLAIAVASGDQAEATRQLQAILRKGGFPSPLLDYGYNLLASADPDAIVLTNGDNDTFPALALQAVFGVRRDVQIVNLSLLNGALYAKVTLADSKTRPRPFTEAELDALWKSAKPPGRRPFQIIAAELVRKVASGSWKRPVYFATSVALASLQDLCKQPLVTEGLLYRVRAGDPVTPGAEATFVNAAKTDSLLGEVFRMESATDFGYAWSKESSVSSLMWNYVSLWQQSAAKYAAGGDLAGLRRMMRSAIAMLRAHPELRGAKDEDHLVKLLDYWKELDPGNPEVDALKRDLRK